MKMTAVIMAGGRGERFWPQSRQSCPKQFLSLTDDGRTMLQQTAMRVRALASYEDMFVVTNKEYSALVKKQLPQIPAENILAEPVPRGTAPCIGFAAAVIGRKYEDAVMLVLPSDHLIRDEEAYARALKQAASAAEKDDNPVTIGITPTFPETGYGYICFEPEKADDRQSGAHAVLRFVEKPDVKTAKAYLDSGRYLWNSGMFIWKASTILGRFRELLPDMYKGILMIRDAWGTPSFERMLANCYAGFASESIDYGIMERTDRIFTVPGNFGWDDAGSWLVLERMNETDENGNMVRGDVITTGTKNSIIVSGGKLIAAVGLSDIVIVDTGDALLVCDKAHAQDVRHVVAELKCSRRTELL